MLFVDLLRVTVLLVAAVATALAAITLLAVDRNAEEGVLVFSAVWWLGAALIGALMGRSRRAAEAMTGVLASARMRTSLPSDTPARIAIGRLWPIAAFAIVVGGLAWLIPQAAAVGAGYALLIALAWRRREAAVSAIEERDGVRFYVEPGSALQPVTLIRTPGLGRDRMPSGHPPPPPPAD
jgi:hypothetical protein